MIAPLFVNSMYSLLYGTASPEALAKKAAALGYGALALTDRNSVYGLPAFIEACKQERLRPILGTELVYRETRQENTKEAAQEARKEYKQEVKKEIMQEGRAIGRAILLAKDKKGFSIISNLLTTRALNKEEPFDAEAVLAALTQTAGDNLMRAPLRNLTRRPQCDITWTLGGKLTEASMRHNVDAWGQARGANHHNRRCSAAR